MIQKWSKNGPKWSKKVQRWFKNEPKMVKNGQKMILKWSKSGQKWSKNVSIMVQKWFKMAQKWSKNGSKVDHQVDQSAKGSYLYSCLYSPTAISAKILLRKERFLPHTFCTSVFKCYLSKKVHIWVRDVIIMVEM